MISCSESACDRTPMKRGSQLTRGFPRIIFSPPPHLGRGRGLRRRHFQKIEKFSFGELKISVHFLKLKLKLNLNFL